MKLAISLLLFIGVGLGYFLARNPTPLNQIVTNEFNPAGDKSFEAPKYIPLGANSQAISQSIKQNRISQKKSNNSNSSQTLSAAYIEKVIASRRIRFQNCQKNTLRTQKYAVGDAIVGFSISPLGTVDKVKLLNSTLNNKDMERCILDVFKRIKFKKFTDEDVYLSYPISFK